MLFKDDNVRESHKQYYLPNVEINDYNLIIHGRNFFYQPIKNDYTTGYLLDYPYFKKYCKLVAIDLRKQQKLNADPREIQQINFTGNLDRAEGATMFFIIEEAKETVLDFSKEAVKALWFYFALI